MSYLLYKSDGTLLTTVVDGTMDGPNQTTASSGLYFAGPNFVGYGLYLNENFVKLLENFASNTSPQTTNLQGQLWYNKSSQTLNVYTDLGDGHPGYFPVSPVTTSSTQPATARQGDIWFNQGTNQTYLYNNGAFNLIGPQYTKSQGISGAIPTVVNDGFAVGVTHNVLQLQFGNVVVATISGDPAFTPATPITGFGTINPGITFSSLVANPTINSNLVGSVVGSVTGNLTGNVVATTLSGTLTGRVIGDVTGNITGTTLTGSLFGNLTSTVALVTNFSTANAVITGGSITGINNLSATAISTPALGTNTLVATNFSTGNAQITGGSVAGLNNLYADVSHINNFSTANAVITGGSIINISIENATTMQTTNFSSPNVIIGGGSATLNSLGSGTSTATNFSTGNAQITGGNVTGATSVTAASMTATALAATTASFNTVNVTNLSGANISLASGNIGTSIAVTKSSSDNSTSVATTAFVHSVLPRGTVIMWSGSVGTIPAGWALCDGTNGAPNLLNMFVVGAGTVGTNGAQYAPGATGGNASVSLSTFQLPAHSHTLTLSGGYTGSAGDHSHSATSSTTVGLTDPGHQHYIATPGGQGSVNSGDDLVGQYTDGYQNTQKYTGFSSTGITATGTTTTTLSTVRGHVHSISLTGNVGLTGANASVITLPPYYALCYIMKTTG